MLTLVTSIFQGIVSTLPPHKKLKSNWPVAENFNMKEKKRKGEKETSPNKAIATCQRYNLDFSL
jgi:hypothetical protein